MTDDRSKMKNRIILHIDMNSYFASVEQQANPFLRGRSVGVCSYLSPNGCIIASSREAKSRGIKTGCRVNEARRLDPDVVLLENEPAKYRSVTKRIFGILSDYTDTVEPYSIDEAFLDLTGWSGNWEAARSLAGEIQVRIKREAGEWLDSSVGISWTKWLAKFASDIVPKAGILVIDTQERLSELLSGRDLQDAWGINVRTEARLNALGIRDLSGLRKGNPDDLRRSLGRYGYYLWANVNGIEITSVSCGSQPFKSVGHSYCLPHRTTNKDYLTSVLYKLCEKTGRRLRNRMLEARVLHVGWAYVRSGGFFRRVTLPEVMFTTEEIFAPAVKFLYDTDLLMPVRMMAVSVSRLTPPSGQLSLFQDRPGRKELSRAMDRLNDKYGEYTVIRGAMWGTGDMARDRIGFRKTTEV